MKKILLLLLILPTWATPLFSQTPDISVVMKPVKCTPIDNIIQFLKHYEEKLFWIGKDNLTPETQIAIYKNEDVGTWTIIQFDNKMGCVLGVGNLGRKVGGNERQT